MPGAHEITVNARVNGLLAPFIYNMVDGEPYNRSFLALEPGQVLSLVISNHSPDIIAVPMRVCIDEQWHNVHGDSAVTDPTLMPSTGMWEVPQQIDLTPGQIVVSGLTRGNSGVPFASVTATAIEVYHRLPVRPSVLLSAADAHTAPPGTRVVTYAEPGQRIETGVQYTNVAEKIASLRIVSRQTAAAMVKRLTKITLDPNRDDDWTTKLRIPGLGKYHGITFDSLSAPCTIATGR